MAKIGVIFYKAFEVDNASIFGCCSMLWIPSVIHDWTTFCITFFSIGGNSHTKVMLKNSFRK